MINNAMEVITWINLKLLSYKAFVSGERRKVKILNWEIDEVLELSPVVAEQLEAFELNDENWRWNKHLHTLEMNLRLIALIASCFIL